MSSLKSPRQPLELTTAPLSENQENNKIPTGFLTLGSLKVLDRVLGYGSHGTIVFHGELNGRAVAVNRMFSQFHKSIDREIASLIRSDGHPNVVRFLKEEKMICSCHKLAVTDALPAASRFHVDLDHEPR
jgi:hypothetical protein